MHLMFALALRVAQDAGAAQPDAAPASASAFSSSGGAILEMVRNSGVVAQGVLVILVLASLFSWAIMFAKWRRFSSARKQSKNFLRTFHKSGRLSEIAMVAEQYQPSPLVVVFTEINDEYHRQTAGRGMPRNPAALERAALTASSEALTAMERNMTWLATIANGATFVGLLGTVMGIIDAFHGLGQAGNGATLRAVAPGISAALITTAAGLVVAIPALVGYNQFTAQLREFAARMDDFGRELLNAIENAALAPIPTAPPTPHAAEDPGSGPRRRAF